MTESADRLAEELPKVPIRQWVLSVPHKLRFLFAKNSKLKQKALTIFLREVFAWLRKRCCKGARSKCGSVTATQRFGSTLNANVHFHSVLLDGIYDGTIFHPAPAPTQEELTELVTRIRDKILKAVAKAGYRIDSAADKEVDAEAEEPSLLDTVRAASIKELIAFSGTEGLRRMNLAGRGEFEPEPSKAGCADADGFSLHANVRIRSGDLEGRKRLLRYILRPPFSIERLEVDEKGQVVYRLKRKRRDGATHLVMTPMEFLEKLAALMPEPGTHLVQYHGVLGPNSKWRKAVETVDLFKEGEQKPKGNRRRGRGKKAKWAELLKKTFGVDVLKCPKCDGRMKLIAMITREKAIRKILKSMGYAVEEMDEMARCRPARDPPERGQGQAEFEE